MSQPNEQTSLENLAEAALNGWGELAFLGILYLAWYLY